MAPPGFLPLGVLHGRRPAPATRPGQRPRSVPSPDSLRGEAAAAGCVGVRKGEWAHAPEVCLQLGEGHVLQRFLTGRRRSKIRGADPQRAT